MMQYHNFVFGKYFHRVTLSYIFYSFYQLYRIFITPIPACSCDSLYSRILSYSHQMYPLGRRKIQKRNVYIYLIIPLYAKTRPFYYPIYSV
jgi:hypothetical protein